MAAKMFQHGELPQKFNWVDMEEDKRKQKLKAGKEKVHYSPSTPRTFEYDAYACWQDLVCWHNLETETAWRGKTKLS